MDGTVSTMVNNKVSPSAEERTNKEDGSKKRTRDTGLKKTEQHQSIQTKTIKKVKGYHQRIPGRLLRALFGVAFFNFGYNFVTTAEYANLKQILGEDGVGLTNNQLGTLLAMMLTAVCLGAIIGGIVSDRQKTKIKGKKRAPIILLGTISSSLIFFLIPLITQGLNEPRTQLIILIITLFLAKFVLGMALAPWLALLSDLFRKKERAWAGLTINALGAGGAAIAMISFGSLIDNKQSWIIWIIIGGALLGSTIIAVLLYPKEQPQESIISKELPQKNLKEKIKEYSKKTGIIILLTNTLWSFSSHLVEIGMIYSLVERFTITNTAATTAYLLMGVCSIVVAIPVILMINWTGKKRASILASIIYGGFCFGLASLKQFQAVYYIIIVGGIGNMLISTLQLALPADEAPKNNEGTFFALFFIFGTFIKPVASLIEGAIIEGKTTNITFRTFGGYPWVFLIAGIVGIVAAIILTINELHPNQRRMEEEERE
ncbi:MAG: MFS transporter [Candidatus Heimdallarchaeota archaeon]|nr:MFS transporter [Candidatus Heimdallarchaeota archaeon]